MLPTASASPWFLQAFDTFVIKRDNVSGHDLSVLPELSAARDGCVVVPKKPKTKWALAPEVAHCFSHAQKRVPNR